ncbi:MAG: hypothetical protein IKN64_08035 [Desulfovibrio sp.]|nr:hypothetical protein [Desulfovibrio sp.]
MAKQNAQVEIIDLTELIERGPNTEEPAPAAAAEKPAVPSTKSAPSPSNETPTQAQTLNDPPSEGDDSDLDILLAQIAKTPEVDSTPKKPLVDTQEKLDMSGLDEADDLLSGLKMPERTTPQPAAEEQNSIDELLSEDGTAESSPENSKKDELKKSVDDDLNQLLADLDKETAQTTQTSEKSSAAVADDLDALMNQLDQPAAPTAKAAPAADDIDALLGEMQAQASEAPAKAQAAPAAPTAKAAPAADDIDALLGEMQAQAKETPTAPEVQAQAPATEDLDALIGQLDQPEAQAAPVADAQAAPAAPVAKAAPAADDIDALLGEMQAQAKEAPAAPEVQAQAPATENLDALMGQLDQPEAQAAPVAEEVAAPAQAPVTEDLDALMGQLGQPEAQESPVAEDQESAEEAQPAGERDALLQMQAQAASVTAPEAEDGQASQLLDQLQNIVEKAEPVAGENQTGEMPVNDLMASVPQAEALASEAVSQPLSEPQAASASPELMARVNELEARFADFAAQLEKIQDGLTERMEICETTLSDVQLSFSGLRDELTAIFDPDKLLAQDSPLTQHIAQTISSSLEQGMQKFLEEAESQKSLHKDVTDRLDTLNAKVQGLCDEPKGTPLEDIEKLLEEKTATLSSGISTLDLEQRLEPVILASEKSSSDFQALSQKLDEMTGELARKSEKNLEQVMSKIEAYDLEGLEKRFAAVQREKEVLAARVDSLEKRIDTLEPTFNARIDKAAAGAAARILREELRVLLGQA